MKNLFDSENFPDEVPEELEAGSRWAWTRSDITEAYPPADYTLRFDLQELDTPYGTQTFDANKVSDAHVVEVAHGTTASYGDGAYSWKAVVVRDSDSAEVLVDSGFLTITPNIEWVYAVLENIRTNVKARASKGEASYGIGGRSISWRTYDELLALEKEFARRWDRVKDKSNRKAGRPSRRNILAKMSA